jgi:hypothetical protein
LRGDAARYGGSTCSGIGQFVLTGRTSKVFERGITDLQATEVLSSLVEARLISTAAAVEIGELNRIILPPADGAAEERARRTLIERKAVTARAGKRHS